MKYILIVFVVFSTMSTYALATMKNEVPEFLEIAREADGSIKTMNQKDAIEFCNQLGAHLPSARELTYLSMKYGAKGIKADECRPSEKCTQIIAFDFLSQNFSRDVFSFSHEGYMRPANEIGSQFIWSSSQNFGHYGKDSYFLWGIYGALSLGPEEMYNAVICVSGRL